MSRSAEIQPAASAAKKQRGRPFQKGVSGNPKGRPKGCRNWATRLAEQLLQDHIEALVKAAIHSAVVHRDAAMMRICMERLIPPMRSLPINLQIPRIRNAADIQRATALTLAALGRGELPPDAAESVIGMLESAGQAIERAEIEARLSKLERQLVTHAVKSPTDSN